MEFRVDTKSLSVHLMASLLVLRVLASQSLSQRSRTQLSCLLTWLTFLCESSQVSGLQKTTYLSASLTYFYKSGSEIFSRFYAHMQLPM